MKRNCHWCIFGIIVLLMLLFPAVMLRQMRTGNVEAVMVDFKKEAPFASKSQIVSEINYLTGKLEERQKSLGRTGSGGYKVYSGWETKRLLEIYREIRRRLDYLNSGGFPVNADQWEGFRFFTKNLAPFQEEQVARVMKDLQKSELPAGFLMNYSVYLLPYSIPNISGLGGVGYTILSAHPAAERDTDQQLQVTLNHEIGHHLHLKYMPLPSPKGVHLWREYHRIRGGTWRGPGPVNTSAWSNSSEENFAEDFRMLFGSNQPFYGDIYLGDPRANPSQTEALKKFMYKVAKGKTVAKYDSPWIPREGLIFWQLQESVIGLLWGITGAGVGILFRQNDPPKNTGRCTCDQGSTYTTITG